MDIQLLSVQTIEAAPNHSEAYRLFDETHVYDRLDLELAKHNEQMMTRSQRRAERGQREEEGTNSSHNQPTHMQPRRGSEESNRTRRRRVKEEKEERAPPPDIESDQQMNTSDGEEQRKRRKKEKRRRKREESESSPEESEAALSFSSHDEEDERKRRKRKRKEAEERKRRSRSSTARREEEEEREERRGKGRVSEEKEERVKRKKVRKREATPGRATSRDMEADLSPEHEMDVDVAASPMQANEMEGALGVVTCDEEAKKLKQKEAFRKLRLEEEAEKKEEERKAEEAREKRKRELQAAPTFAIPAAPAEKPRAPVRARNRERTNFMLLDAPAEPVKIQRPKVSVTTASSLRRNVPSSSQVPLRVSRGDVSGASTVSPSPLALSSLSERWHRPTSVSEYAPDLPSIFSSSTPSSSTLPAPSSSRHSSVDFDINNVISAGKKIESVSALSVHRSPKSTKKPSASGRSDHLMLKEGSRQWREANSSSSALRHREGGRREGREKSFPAHTPQHTPSFPAYNVVPRDFHAGEVHHLLQASPLLSAGGVKQHVPPSLYAPSHTLTGYYNPCSAEPEEKQLGGIGRNEGYDGMDAFNCERVVDGGTVQDDVAMEGGSFSPVYGPEDDVDVVEQQQESLEPSLSGEDGDVEMWKDDNVINAAFLSDVLLLKETLPNREMAYPEVEQALRPNRKVSGGLVPYHVMQNYRVFPEAFYHLRANPSSDFNLIHYVVKNCREEREVLQFLLAMDNEATVMCRSGDRLMDNMITESGESSTSARNERTALAVAVWRLDVENIKLLLHAGAHSSIAVAAAESRTGTFNALEYLVKDSIRSRGSFNDWQEGAYNYVCEMLLDYGCSTHFVDHLTADADRARLANPQYPVAVFNRRLHPLLTFVHEVLRPAQFMWGCGPFSRYCTRMEQFPIQILEPELEMKIPFSLPVLPPRCKYLLVFLVARGTHDKPQGYESFTPMLGERTDPLECAPVISMKDRQSLRCSSWLSHSRASPFVYELPSSFFLTPHECRLHVHTRRRTELPVWHRVMVGMVRVEELAKADLPPEQSQSSEARPFKLWPTSLELRNFITNSPSYKALKAKPSAQKVSNTST